MENATALKLHHIHVHLSLIFPKKWARLLVLLFTPGIYVVHKMSIDPVWQFKFNAFFTVFWVGTMCALPEFHSLYGNTPGLIIEEVSLWANMISHFGAMGANLAAIISGMANANPERQIAQAE